MTAFLGGARRRRAYPTSITSTTAGGGGGGYTGPQALQRDGAFIWWPMQAENIQTGGLVNIIDPDFNPARNSVNQSANNIVVDDYVSGERMVRFASANIDTIALGSDINATGFTASISVHRNTFVGTTDVRFFAVFQGATRSAGVQFLGGAMNLVNNVGTYTATAGARSTKMGTERITFRRTPDGLGQVIDEVFANSTKIWTTGLFTPVATTGACFFRLGDGAALPPTRDLHIWLSPRTDDEINAQVFRYQPWLVAA